MPQYQIVDSLGPNGEETSWVCIRVVEDDGRVSSRSWAPAEIDPAIRLNPSFPEAKDLRGGGNSALSYRLPTPTEWESLGFSLGDARHQRQYEALAAAVVAHGLVPAHEVARLTEIPLESLLASAESAAPEVNG